MGGEQQRMTAGVFGAHSLISAHRQVRLADGVHTVRLEHGSTSGKRVITVDGKEVSHFLTM